MRATFAILGSMTLQGPVTQWVTDHRKHHALSDEEGDPHSPHAGFAPSAWGALRASCTRTGLAVPPQGDGARRALRQGSLRRPADPRHRPHLLRMGRCSLRDPVRRSATRPAAPAGNGLQALLWGGLIRDLRVPARDVLGELDLPHVRRARLSARATRAATTGSSPRSRSARGGTTTTTPSPPRPGTASTASSSISRGGRSGRSRSSAWPGTCGCRATSQRARRRLRLSPQPPALKQLDRAPTPVDPGAGARQAYDRSRPRRTAAPCRPRGMSGRCLRSRALRAFEAAQRARRAHPRDPRQVPVPGAVEHVESLPPQAVERERSGIHGARPSTPATAGCRRRDGDSPAHREADEQRRAGNEIERRAGVRNARVELVPGLDPVAHLGEGQVAQTRRESVARSSLVALHVPGTARAVPPFKSTTAAGRPRCGGARRRPSAAAPCGSSRRQRLPGRAGSDGIGNCAGSLAVARLVPVEAVVGEPVGVVLHHLGPVDELDAAVFLRRVAEHGVERVVRGAVAPDRGPDDAAVGPASRSTRDTSARNAATSSGGSLVPRLTTTKGERLGLSAASSLMPSGVVRPMRSLATIRQPGSASAR